MKERHESPKNLITLFWTAPRLWGVAGGAARQMCEQLSKSVLPEKHDIVQIRKIRVCLGSKKISSFLAAAITYTATLLCQLRSRNGHSSTWNKSSGIFGYCT